MRYLELPQDTQKLKARLGLELSTSRDRWIALPMIVGASPLLRSRPLSIGTHTVPPPGSIERWATVAGEWQTCAGFVRARRHLCHGLARGSELPLIELAI